MQLKSLFALGGIIEYILVLLFFTHSSKQCLKLLLAVGVKEPFDLTIG